MDKFIEDLLEQGMGRIMYERGNALAQADEIYLDDCKDENDLKQRYERLCITREQRMVINDDIACTLTVSHRYSELSYIAGVKDTVGMLVSLGMIKGVEAE